MWELHSFQQGYLDCLTRWGHTFLAPNNFQFEVILQKSSLACLRMTKCYYRKLHELEVLSPPPSFILGSLPTSVEFSVTITNSSRTSDRVSELFALPLNTMTSQSWPLPNLYCGATCCHTL